MWPDPIGHFGGPLVVILDFAGVAGAGSEHVPLAPLGWYYQQKFLDLKNGCNGVSKWLIGPELTTDNANARAKNQTIFANICIVFSGVPTRVNF